MGGLVKLGGAGDGGEVGLQRQCPVHAVFGGKSEHVAVLGIVGMHFGEFGEFVGGGLQVTRIEGQVGLIVQFFVLAVVFSEHVFLSGRAGWKRRFAVLFCIRIGAVRCFQTANTADRSFFRATWRLGSARPGL